MRKHRQLKYKVLQFIALIPTLAVMYAVLNYQAQLDPLLRVINNFGTFLHEAGHGLTAMITGGNLFEVLIKNEGGGHAMTSGGIMFFILPAGYLSTTLVTALMFWINNRSKWGEVIPLLMGLSFLFLTFFYGASVTGGIKTTIVGYACGIFLLYVGIHPTIRIPKTTWSIALPDWLWMFCVNVLSMYYALGGVLSLRYIALNSISGNGDDITRFADTYVSWAHPPHVAWFFCGLSILIWILVIFDCLRVFVKKEEK